MTGRKPCACCAKGFTCIADMCNHIKNEHQNSEFRCTVCNAMYYRQHSLTRHVNATHRELAKQILPTNYHSCVICGVCFKNKKWMTAHKKATGHVIKEEEVQVTTSEFDNALKLLKTHKLPNKARKSLAPANKPSVKGLKNLHQSPVTPKTLTQRGRPVILPKIQPRPIPLPNAGCYRCPFRSESKSLMSVHETCHNVVSPNVCSLCTYSCTSSDMLARHSQSHFVSHSDLPCKKLSLWSDNSPTTDSLICPFCGVPFQSTLERQNHQNLHK